MDGAGVDRSFESWELPEIVAKTLVFASSVFIENPR